MSGAGVEVGGRPVLSIGGSPLADDLLALVRSVVVDTDSSGPDSCRVVLDDPARDALTRAGIDLRAGLSVAAGRVGEDQANLLFDGVVYALGSEFDERGSLATVVAYDRSYDLYTGLHTVSYHNVTDSDLASQLARESGLKTGRVTSTSVVHDHVAQVNETHFDFLARRAREADCQVLVTGSELNFVPSAEAGEGPAPGDFDSVDPLQLVPGQNVERLTTRLTAAQQVAEVEVRGWDPRTKQTVVATAPAATRTAQLVDTPVGVAAGGRTPRHVTVDLPLATQAECDAVAAAQAERIAGSFVHAEGVSRGDPRLVAGVAVSLGRSGVRFEGKVTISRARHVWDDRGYRTTFVASGAHDRSVLGLVTGESARAADRRTAGLAVGIVTNVSDPDDSGRVKVRFPWLNDDYESDWVRVVQLGAGLDRGLRLLPEVNDEVLVGFEQGDMRRPYLIGGLYNGVDTAPFGSAVDAGTGAVTKRGLCTPSGHELLFTDSSSEEKIELRTKDTAVSLTLDARSGELTVETRGDVKVKAGGNADVRAEGDFSLDAPGAGTITAGRSLTLKSSGEVTIRGAMIKLN